MQKPFVYLGEIVACDEKLWHCDSEASGWIKVVKAKKDVGIWNFTAVVWLECQLPYVIYTRAYTEISKLGEIATTFEIVKDWCDLLENYSSPNSTLVMDAYYLTW